jgi:hypothetical protein
MRSGKHESSREDSLVASELSPERSGLATFASSRVVVVSSVQMMDAFGISRLGGMKTGCAAVASELRGVAEVAGDAGLLVPRGDVVLP